MHREPRGNGGRCFAFPAPASLRPGRAVTSGLREDSTDIYPCSPPIPRPWRGLAQTHRRRQTASGDRGSQRPRQQQGPVTLPGRSPAASLALVRGFVPAETRARDPPPTQGLALPGMPCPATCLQAATALHAHGATGISRERRQSSGFAGETLNKVKPGLHHCFEGTVPFQGVLCLLAPRCCMSRGEILREPTRHLQGDCWFMTHHGWFEFPAKLYKKLGRD